MNTETLNFLKQTILGITPKEALAEYSNYMLACMFGWWLITGIAALCSYKTYRHVKQNHTGEGVEIIAAAVVWIVSFGISLLILDAVTKAMFPLGALINNITNK